MIFNTALSADFLPNFTPTTFLMRLKNNLFSFCSELLFYICLWFSWVEFELL